MGACPLVWMCPQLVPSTARIETLDAASPYALQDVNFMMLPEPWQLNSSAVKSALGGCSLGQAPVADATAEQNEQPRAEAGCRVVK